MAIDDMILGNHNIVKAYKGDTLIFDRNREEYIQSTLSYNSSAASGGGFIAVSDFELYSDYKYEVDVELNGLDAVGPVIIGGTNTDAGGYGKGLSCGFFLVPFCVGTVYYSDSWGIGILQNDHLTWPWGYEIYTLPGCVESIPRSPGEEPVFPMRQTFTFYNPNAEPWQVNTLSGRDAKRMTTGGFYLMAGRCGIDNPETVYDGQYTAICPYYSNFGKVYRVSIYDTNGTTLIHNFKPKIQNDHIGMIDLVSGTFYPCNDDTKFRIGR